MLYNNSRMNKLFSALDRFKKPRKFKSTRTSKKGGHRYKGVDKKLVILTYAVSAGLTLTILGIVFVMGLFLFYSRELPDPDVLLERSDELSSKLFDRAGKPIYEVYGEKNRQLIKLEDVSPHMANATLAIEDANFYNHRGFYFLGMVRGTINSLRGKGLQSGSTLTQQVVKNAVLTQEQTLTRKIKELSMALQLENKYSKEQILQMYLNETPYGGQNYGVFTAAKAYFNKTPKDLTLAESAYLAGLPQSPSRYSFFGADPQAGFDRKDYVLLLMRTKGWVGADGQRHFITEEEYESAKNEELDFQKGMVDFRAPHFVFYVKQELAEIVGEELVEQGGLEVTTTLDLDYQDKAQQIVKEEVDRASAQGLRVGNGSLVAIEPSTGHILAMVGSKDYFGEQSPEGCTPGAEGETGCVFDPNVNVATSLRQPGSSIKPITYATMLAQGYTSAFPFLDVRTNFPGSAPDRPYIPVNYDGFYRGPVSLRRSLANSLNIPAVKALQIVGIDNMLDTAENMGITTLTDRERYGLALTLGGGETKLVEMTGAFATFANNGVYMKPSSIIEVKNARGQVLYKNNSIGREAIDPEIAFLISDILSDDGARSSTFGVNSLLNIPGHQVAVKTGTTDDLRDNYAIGYTKDVAIGTWVGNNNNAAMSSVASGITGATPIWHRAMVEFLSGKPAHSFESHPNVQKMNVDTLTGMLPQEDFPARSEWFIKGTEPTAPSEWYQRLEICKPDGKLASSACRNAGKTETKTFIDVKAELPVWQPYVNAWFDDNYKDDERYFPPKTVSTLEFDDDGDVTGSGISVVIANFKDDDNVPLQFRLEVEVSSAEDVEWVKIYVDGNEITEDKSEPYGYNFSFSSSEAGVKRFRVKARNDDGKEAEHEIELNVGGN